MKKRAVVGISVVSAILAFGPSARAVEADFDGAKGGGLETFVDVAKLVSNINGIINGGAHQAPHPAHTHPVPHGHPGVHVNPSPVNPSNPAHPSFPPAQPPFGTATGYERLHSFTSGTFEWATDARKSMEDAARALKASDCYILEERLDNFSYTLVFESPRRVRIARYDSQVYEWSIDTQEAAKEFVRLFESRGMVILEKNIRRDSFSVSYFDPRD